MSERPITTCDVPPCTKTKGEGNGWLKVSLDTTDFVIAAPGRQIMQAQLWTDVCSEQCLMRALQNWLEKQRGYEREKTQEAEL